MPAVNPCQPATLLHYVNQDYSTRDIARLFRRQFANKLDMVPPGRHPHARTDGADSACLRHGPLLAALVGADGNKEGHRRRFLGCGVDNR